MDLVTACRTRRLLGAPAVAQDARGVCRLPHTPLALPTQIFGGIQVIPAWRRQVLAGIFSLWVNRLSSDRWPEHFLYRRQVLRANRWSGLPPDRAEQRPWAKVTEIQSRSDITAGCGIYTAAQ